MVLRKPYAFFIKIFKPVHFIISLLILYSIILNNKILGFLNSYLHSTQGVVDNNLSSTYINKLIFVIPIIVIIFSIIFLGVMYRKKKPVLFYFVGIFSFIVVLIICSYSSNFFHILESSIVSIGTVKLIHDLILISIIIQSVLFVLYLVRGMGLNFKKFDFDSDISKFDVDESDKEEFEVSVNIDFDESKRKRKEKLRHFKYFYYENKFKINISIISFLVLVSVIVLFIFLQNKKNSKFEGQIYGADSFNIGVESTSIIDKSYSGKLLTLDDGFILVVKILLNSPFENEIVNLDSLKLSIGDILLLPSKNYSNEFLDLGNIYNGQVLTNEITDYLLVYEVPNKYSNSDMTLLYKGLDFNLRIKLKPQKYISKSVSVTNKIGENMQFVDSLEGISFKIDQYDINNEFVINYNYCIKDNDCIPSKEHLRPTLSTNYDKYVLKLNVEFSNNSKFDINSFYELLSKFGSIQYKIDDTWYSQNLNFEEIKSKKVKSKNTEYIGINSNIYNSSEIKMVFNVRDYKYEYTLK